jgi:hypothetical protein
VVEPQSENGSTKTVEECDDFQISRKSNTKRDMNNLYFVQELNLSFPYKSGVYYFVIYVGVVGESGLDTYLISL